jgi:solute carrier family 41
MDKRNELKSMIIGNIVLIQLQAIVVGFLAAIVSLAMGWVPQGYFNLRHALVICSSSVSTASITSLALGTVMIIVIVLSHKCKINPDNIATPIAASLGDLTTLTILAGTGGFIFQIIGIKTFSI